MIALCMVCSELLDGGVVGELDAEKGAVLEFNRLAEAARRHIGIRHRDVAQAFSPLMEMVGLYLSSLILQGTKPEIERGRMKETLLEALAGCQIVTLESSPAAAGNRRPPVAGGVQ